MVKLLLMAAEVGSGRLKTQVPPLVINEGKLQEVKKMEYKLR